VPALSSSLISPALEQLASPPGHQLSSAGCPGLREFLSAVPDPRDPRGVRHSLSSVLLISVAAVLAGARSLTAIGEWAADAPVAVMAALGVRFDPLEGRFRPPGEATIRRVLESADAGKLDAAVTSWLASTAAPASRRRAVAVDGKALRGTRHSASDGQAAHLLAAIDQQAGTVLAQTAVDGKTNEVRREALCRIPDSVRRNPEGSSWARWLTRIRKVRGTRACHENLRSCPETRSDAQGSPRDRAKARLPESQSPVMQIFIRRKWSLKPVPRAASCYLVGGATSGVAGDAQ
jgi:DDE_Tnp_1-associated